MSCCPVFATQDSPLKIEDVAGDLAEAKTIVYGHVADLKAKFASQPTAKELEQGKALYDKAQAAYTNWISTLHFAILDGSVKKLGRDTSYQAKAKNAGMASGEFVKYAESQTATSQGVFVFASDAATIGIKIWNAYKDRQLEDRQAFLKDFDAYVKWDDWKSAGSATASPEKSSTPGKATDTSSTTAQTTKGQKKKKRGTSSSTEKQ